MHSAGQCTKPAALTAAHAAGVDAPAPCEMPYLELPPLPSLEPLAAKGKKGWRTYQPNVLKRKRTHGFLQCAARTRPMLGATAAATHVYMLPLPPPAQGGSARRIRRWALTHPLFPPRPATVG